MSSESLRIQAEEFLQKDPAKQTQEEGLALYQELVIHLETGALRVAEKDGGNWRVNSWIKQVILLGFKYGTLVAAPQFSAYPYYDKNTMALRVLSIDEGIRMVPGGSAVRCGSYIALGTVIMPPAYINIGAYIDAGVMIDSHALVGSCAQVGKNVHISAAAQIGGVLEPVGSLPIIIEDNVFIGGNAGLYDGVRVSEGAVLGSGVIINGSTPVFDSISGVFIKNSGDGLIIPQNAVVVAGSRPMLSKHGQEHQIQIYCPIIIKYRDDKTQGAVALEEVLR